MRLRYIRETIRMMRRIRSEERLKKVYTTAVTLLRIEEEGVRYEYIRQDKSQEIKHFIPK